MHPGGPERLLSLPYRLFATQDLLRFIRYADVDEVLIMRRP